MGWIEWIRDVNKEYGGMRLSDLIVLLIPIWGVGRIQQYKKQAKDAIEATNKERDASQKQVQEAVKIIEDLDISITPNELWFGQLKIPIRVPESLRGFILSNKSSRILTQDIMKEDNHTG